MKKLLQINLFVIVVGMLLLVSISQVAFAAPSAKVLKVTGGGWIIAEVTNTPPDLNDKKTFGFNVQMVSTEQYKGELQYVDHDFGYVVHSTSIDSLTISVDGTTASFTGSCRVNGVKGYSFTVNVEDNGEPGVGVDRFQISINGPGLNYYTDNPLLSGGNIQIHGA